MKKGTHKNKWNISVPNKTKAEEEAMDNGNFLFLAFVFVFVIGIFTGWVFTVNSQNLSDAAISFKDHQCLYDWPTASQDLSTVRARGRLVKGPGVWVTMTCKDEKFFPYLDWGQAND